MRGIISYITTLWSNTGLRKKILITLGLLALYRLLVMIPVPFANVDVLMAQTQSATEGLGYFVMLFGGSLDQFSLIAVGLTPFINASIIVQLLTVVIPHFEELQEMGDQGNKQLQIYMRYMTFPLAFLQSIGMVFLINSMFTGLIDTSSRLTILFAAFVMAVGSMVMLFISDIITEKGITNGTSLIIFAGIIAGVVTQATGSFSAGSGTFGIVGILFFMILIMGGLVALSILLLKTMKHIPVIYARQGKVQETSKLPIPLNPVGMIPIIFALAFTSFPYLLSQVVMKFGMPSSFIGDIAQWVNVHFNIYTQQPGVWAIVFYFLCIVFFTYFYTLITFNPDKIADNIQKRGGFVPGIRPGDETAKYIKGILNHLSLWGGIGLGVLGIYSYVLYYIPFIQDISVQLGSIPVIVTGSGIIIIVGVIQQLMDKIQTDMLMAKYETTEE